MPSSGTTRISSSPTSRKTISKSSRTASSRLPRYWCTAAASTTSRPHHRRRAQEGIILPPSRPRNDAAGRIFLIIVDDLHLDFRNTGRIRDLFKRISKQLVHEGDMFGIVSTGPSSLAIDLTYDRKILDDAIKKISGNGLKPSDIIQGAEGAEGPSEVRYRAHVAFSTA